MSNTVLNVLYASEDMRLISRCVILTCLLQIATVRSNGAVPPVPCRCDCPKPTQLKLTEDPAGVNCCTDNSRYRYKCVANHLRKAGTSNLVVCRNKDGKDVWSKPTLQCIPDPGIVSTAKQPDVSPSPHGKCAWRPFLRPMARESTTHQGIHQPTHRTTVQSDDAPSGLAMMPTHADTAAPTSPVPTTTTSPAPTTTTTTSPAPTTTTTSPAPTTTTTTTTTSPSPTTTTTTTTSPSPTTTTTATTATTATTSPTQGVLRTDGGLRHLRGTSASPPGPPGSPETTHAGQSEGHFGAAVPTGLSVAALLLICTVLGLFFCLWRRHFHGSHIAAETSPMYTGPAMWSQIAIDAV
ncbi:unnamed protein product [Lota lota]